MPTTVILSIIRVLEPAFYLKESADNKIVDLSFYYLSYMFSVYTFLQYLKLADSSLDLPHFLLWFFKKRYFFYGVGIIHFKRQFPSECGGTLLQNCYKPNEKTNEKLHCKGELYRNSG